LITQCLLQELQASSSAVRKYSSGSVQSEDHKFSCESISPMNSLKKEKKRKNNKAKK